MFKWGEDVTGPGQLAAARAFSIADCQFPISTKAQEPDG
jgi:hypothetical protein